MEKQTLVLAAHVVVALGLATFGAYRLTLGRVVPGALNVAMAVAVTGVGVYAGRLSRGRQ